nr:hypothetical protein RVX_2485 [Nitratidesulfovibrio sp. HK-II]
MGKRRNARACCPAGDSACTYEHVFICAEYAARTPVSTARQGWPGGNRALHSPQRRNDTESAKSPACSRYGQPGLKRGRRQGETASPHAPKDRHPAKVAGMPWRMREKSRASASRGMLRT